MSRNSYADAGFKNPELWAQKADLVSEIRLTMSERGFTPSRAARTVGMALPEFQAMLKGHFGDVELLSIVECARRLGHDIEISYQPLEGARRHRGAVTLHSGQGSVTSR